MKTLENNYLVLSSKKDNEKTIKVKLDYLYKKYRSLQVLTPIQLLHLLKARHALNLMVKTHYSLKQIAYSSGFHNYRQFWRCIRHIFNRSPKEIRGRVQDIGAKQVWEQAGSSTSS